MAVGHARRPSSSNSCSTANWAEIFRDKPPRDQISIRNKNDDYKTLFAPEYGVKDGGLALPKGIIAGVSIEGFFRVRG